METLPEQPKKLTAYELLGTEPRPYPLISQYFNPVFGGALGVGCVLFYNFISKRPIMSGIQRHVAFGAVGFVLGTIADNRRNNKMARRDAVFRHYIELHPEDFPEPERKKFKDILMSWTPIR